MRKMFTRTIATRRWILSRRVSVSHFLIYSKPFIMISILARARTKAKEGVTEGWFAKFPKDVIYCEQLTKGNPNILNEEPFAEKKKEKVDYSLIFGDPDEIKTKKEEIIQKSVTKRIRSRLAGGEDSPRPQITHPRFLGHSDHTVRILTQPSTPYHVHSEEAPPAGLQHSAGYSCTFCPFTSSRVNVMMMHSKSHSAPDKTSLANFAKSRPGPEARVRSEVKGSRLFADARAGIVKKRKLVYNTASSKVNSEPIKKKTKVTKKQKKKENDVREEKKNSIFGDWSEDENEEEEEKVKLQESINNIVDGDSEEDFFSFKTDKELKKGQNSQSESKRPQRNVKKSSEKTQNVKKKVRKRQSATDAVNNLIKSSLSSRTEDPESMEEDDLSDNYDVTEDMGDMGLSPPPSPPPTTPSKKPVILKKSSTRSFQLPTRPDGKLELIKHDSKDASDTKYQGLSAKAKAKQLARNQMSSNELFDKLIENDAKRAAKEEEDVKKDRKSDAKPSNGGGSTEDAMTETCKTLETYDFDFDSEPVVKKISNSPLRMESPVKETKKVKDFLSKADSPKSSNPSVINKLSETFPVKLTEIPSSTLPNPSTVSSTKTVKKPSLGDSIVKDTDELLSSVKDIVKDTDTLLSSAPQSTVKTSVSVFSKIATNKPRVVKVSPPVKVVSPVKVASAGVEEVKPKPTVVVVSPPTKANLNVRVTSPNKAVPVAPKVIEKTVISPQKIFIEKPALSPAKALLSPNKKIIVEKPLMNTSKIILDKSGTGPKKISDVKVQNRVVANVSKITLESPKKVSPLVQQKPLIINNEKPVVAGLGLGSKPVIGGVTRITQNIVLSKPVISSSNTTNPSSPLKVGSKIVTLSQKQESPLKSPSSSITLASKKKEEKPLTISLESSRKTTIKPIVKTVEIPKRVSKMVGGALGSSSVSSSLTTSKPVVHLDVSDKVNKAPSLEIKLDTRPALVTQPVPVVTEGTEFIVAVSDAPMAPGVMDTKLNHGVIDTKLNHGVMDTKLNPWGMDTKLNPGGMDTKLNPGGMDNKLNPGVMDTKLNGEKTSLAPVSTPLVESHELPVGETEGEMIYLLVEDGADPNLENQTLYIDPSQLAAAAGGLVLQNDGTMVLQQTSSDQGQLLIQNADGALSNLVILDDKVCHLIPFCPSSINCFLPVSSGGGSLQSAESGDLS